VKTGAPSTFLERKALSQCKHRLVPEESKVSGRMTTVNPSGG